METGYFVHFHSDDESLGKDLPRVIHPGDTLDTDIERIANAIRTWILGPTTGTHLNISLHGPVEGLTAEALRTPEEQLADCKSQDEKLICLGQAAQSRFDAGDFETAREYALELQHIMPSYQDHPYFGSMVASINVVLGRLALREGDVEGAERHLLEAGNSPGSPTMDSFGPNMSLAHDLLLAGHSSAVLEYFKLCAKFWSSDFSQLDQWTQDVLAGRIPNFGANLVY